MGMKMVMIMVIMGMMVVVMMMITMKINGGLKATCCQLKNHHPYYPVSIDESCGVGGVGAGANGLVPRAPARLLD
jgi:hypothetical protein